MELEGCAQRNGAYSQNFYSQEGFYFHLTIGITAPRFW